MKGSCLTAVENIDLKGEDLYLAIENYNRALPRGYKSMKLVYSDNKLFGCLKIYFQFRNPVKLTSVLKIGDVGTEILNTKFQFQTHSTEYIPVTNKSTVGDIIQFVIDQFNIQDPRSQFSLYEKYSDYGNAYVYYSKLNEDDNILNIVLKWSHNKQIKRFYLELYDYNPNVEDFYGDKTVEDLEAVLTKLETEEKKAEAAVREKYIKQHQILSRYLQLKRPEQNSRYPGTSRSLRKRNSLIYWGTEEKTNPCFMQ